MSRTVLCYSCFMSRYSQGALSLLLCRWKSFAILGIESSCDDTGAAVVTSDGTVIGDALHSQSIFSTRMGGVIPNLSKLIHKQNISQVVDNCLTKSRFFMADIAAIAVTVKPGIQKSLEVGVNFAKECSKLNKIPLIPIHHMHAHALTIRLLEDIKFPYMVLLISGGHCLLAVAKNVDDYLMLGKSLDVSPGEAFDKVARRLRLHNIKGFHQVCGGAAIETIVSEMTASDKASNPVYIKEPMTHHRSCDFSFSAFQSSTTKLIEKYENSEHRSTGGVLEQAPQLACAFQSALIKHLCTRLNRGMDYCEREGLLDEQSPCLVVSGGVASNKTIKLALKSLCESRGYKLAIPAPKLCTDNGVMVAWNGVERLRHHGPSILCAADSPRLQPQPQAHFGVDIRDSVVKANIRNRRQTHEGEKL